MEQTMQNIATTLASINAYLAVLAEDVVNKKKKSNTKKEECQQRKKRNVYYTKKTNGEVVMNEDFVKNLTQEELGFYQGMLKDYPNVCMMPDPLTWEQFKQLMQRYGNTKLIMKVIAELDNFSGIDNYKSAYKTLRNWIGKQCSAHS